MESQKIFPLDKRVDPVSTKSVTLDHHEANQDGSTKTSYVAFGEFCDCVRALEWAENEIKRLELLIPSEPKKETHNEIFVTYRSNIKEFTKEHKKLVKVLKRIDKLKLNITVE